MSNKIVRILIWMTMDQDAQHLWIEDAGEIVCYLFGRVNPEKLAQDLQSPSTGTKKYCDKEKPWEKF